MNKIWIPLFSHTGSEVANLLQMQSVVPHLILSNSRESKLVNCGVRDFTSFLSTQDINEVLREFPKIHPNDKLIFTLHGYMNIIQPEALEAPNAEFYNVHPGDIVKYPELRGKDPQAKALNLKLPTTGVVIHKVDEGIDTGEVLLREEYKINEDITLDQLIIDLRNISIRMWLRFMREKFN